ncbi:hypothetical protein A6E01_19010 (plasmid) [Vibrio breoganii]|uniref:Uncharacterized protein n=1 Tax=Vibrio breoganii TaxID=553239 RepID=A0AAN0XZ58_9VIBR|nr:hypothetical protein [Vibrio breoganii]ANO35305.1 hypothetical protein A6E01_19010 [Vibrio breoganii]
MYKYWRAKTKPMTDDELVVRSNLAIKYTGHARYIVLIIVAATIYLLYRQELSSAFALLCLQFAISFLPRPLTKALLDERTERLDKQFKTLKDDWAQWEYEDKQWENDQSSGDVKI